MCVRGRVVFFFSSRRRHTRLQGDWSSDVCSSDLPVERFERYFDFVHDNLAERQKECGNVLGCPLLTIGSEVSTQDQVLRDTVDRILDRKISYFVSAIRDAHSQGLINAPDAEAKARALFACYQGTLTQARIQNDVELIREFKPVAMDVLGVKQLQTTSS